MIQEFIVERPHPDFRSRGYERSRHSVAEAAAEFIRCYVAERGLKF